MVGWELYYEKTQRRRESRGSGGIEGSEGQQGAAWAVTLVRWSQPRAQARGHTGKGDDNELTDPFAVVAVLLHPQHLAVRSQLEDDFFRKSLVVPDTPERVALDML